MVHRASGRIPAPTSVPNAVVTLRISASPLELRATLNVAKKCDIEMTWEEVLRDVYGVNVNAQKFFVKKRQAANETPIRHPLNEKICVLLQEYRQIPRHGEFVVQLVTNSVATPAPKPSPVRKSMPTAQRFQQTSSARGRQAPKPSPPRKTIPTVAPRFQQASPAHQSNHIHGTRQGSRAAVAQKVKLPPKDTSRPAPKRELPSASSSVETAPIPRNSPVNPSPSRNRAGAGNKRPGGTPDGPPPNQRPRHSVNYNVGLPEELTLSNGAFERDRARQRQVFDFDDDAASQFSQGSQESQDDLDDEGISADEDYKPKVMQKLLVVTNVQLIKIREELRKIRKADGKMMRFTAKAPLGVAFLRQLFENN